MLWRIPLCSFAVAWFSIAVTLVPVRGQETDATDPAVVPSKIVAVTLYSSQARVTRELAAPEGAGVNTIAVGVLPPILRADSLQIDGDPHIRILGVRLVRSDGEDHGSPELLELEARKTALERTLTALDRRRGSAWRRFDRYMKLHVTPPEPKEDAEPSLPAIDAESWRAYLDLVRRGFTGALEAGENVEAEIDTARRELAVVVGRLREIAAPARDTDLRAVIAVQNLSGDPGKLRFHYRVPRALWYPAYTLEIDPANARIRLGTYAVVHQRTGEDWAGDGDSGVPLEFSTSIPESGAGLPELLAQHIGRRRYEELPGRIGLHDGLVDSEYEAEEEDLDDRRLADDPSALALPTERRRRSKKRTAESDAWGAPEESRLDFGYIAKDQKDSMAIGAAGRPDAPFVDLHPSFVPPARSSRGFLTTLRSVRAEAVPSDGAPHRLLVSRTTLPYREARTLVAELAPHVYRRLIATLTGEAPLLEGPASVFFGDAYLGVATVATTAPGEELTVNLGVDDRVRVERRDRDREEKIGVFSKGTRYHSEVVVTIESFRDAPIDIEVRERMPFTEEEKMEVALDRSETDPDPSEVEEHTGLVTWNVRLATGERREIVLVYRIDAPRGYQLTRSEDPSRLEEGR